MKKLEQFTNPPGENSLVLITVIRDEEDFVPSFIEHYKNLGVTHFIFVLNNNKDNSINIIKQHCSVGHKIYNPEICIYQTSTSYRDNKFGLVWVNSILDEQCKDLWCVVVDIDEYILPPEGLTLRDIRSQMIDCKANVLQTVLIDFYPRVMDNLKIVSVDGFDPFESSPYYDSITDDWRYFNCMLDDMDKSSVLKGGMRHRCFGDVNTTATNSSTCLSKRSFFKYTFYDECFLDVGMHWIMPHHPNSYDHNWVDLDWEKHIRAVSYHKELIAIAHFKFAKPEIINVFKERVIRNEDWDNSQEYKQYIKQEQLLLFDDEYSCKYIDVKNLYKNTIDNI